MKKTLELTAEQAKEIYAEGGAATRRMLQYTFTPQELGIGPEKPKSWAALTKLQGGWHLNDDADVTFCYEALATNYENRNVWPTEALARASRTSAMLQQLMADDYWNGDWKPNWRSSADKHCVIGHGNTACVGTFSHERQPFAFETEAKAYEFLASYTELIREALGLEQDK